MYNYECVDWWITFVDNFVGLCKVYALKMYIKKIYA